MLLWIIHHGASGLLAKNLNQTEFVQIGLLEICNIERFDLSQYILFDFLRL